MAESQEVIIHFRKNTAEGWLVNDRILDAGEPGFEMDTGRMKIGNGRTPWSRLPYLNSDSDAAAALLAHINSPAPHPVYDDGPTLTLLYENSKV
jgi:hypothetical protein